MDKEKYLKKHRKHKENYLRYRLGFLQLIHKPILNLLLIPIIATFIGNFSNLPIVKNAFAGIRVCVAVLILNTAINLIKTSVIDIKTCIILVLVAGFSIFTDISPVLYVIIAGIAGIVLRSIGGKKNDTN